MLKIRLSKNGYKKKYFFLIIVIDSKKKREGEYIEKLGFYNSLSKLKFINKNKFYYWISRGAKTTKTILNIFNEHIKFNKK